MAFQSIHQASETTGWSPRMLRYLESSGLIRPMRTQGGHRVYAPVQIQRLRDLREIVERFDIGLTDAAFERRQRTERELAHALDEWFGAVHRVAAPERASLYRKLADEMEPFPASRQDESDDPRNV